MSSPFTGLKYQIGKINQPIKIKLSYDCSINKRVICEGYHSYQYGRIVYNADYEWFNLLYENSDKKNVCWGGVKPYECVIPKGTKYYANDDHDVVSETIIVKKRIDYERVSIFTKLFARIKDIFHSII